MTQTENSTVDSQVDGTHFKQTSIMTKCAIVLLTPTNNFGLDLMHFIPLNHTTLYY